MPGSDGNFISSPSLRLTTRLRLVAARSTVKPVTPKRLGAVGPEVLPGPYAIATGVARFGAKPLEAEIPFAVEAWAIKAEKSAGVVYVNRTPRE